ncbi:MAG TPA: polynucleotide adenylyltransferase, partial [Oscillospiraceae bacterium]|nr:polynucleotide adenylyltransferase [Oscillospiraceae bacterium]
MKKIEIKIEMPINVKKILSILYFEGCAGYIVGGCVRDSILGLIPNDWDICTNCVPKDMLHIFSSFKITLTGFKHGTVTVVIGGENYEITTYRIDSNYIDGRHPEKVT